MKLDPLIPVFYGGDSAKYAVTNFIEDFCSSGSKKAYVIHGQKSSTDQKVVIVSKEKASTREVALKVVLYMTVIVPLLIWAAKGLFRLGHTYRIVPSPSLLEKEANVQGQSSKKNPPAIKKNIVNEIQSLVKPSLNSISKNKSSKELDCYLSSPSLPNLKFYFNTSSKIVKKSYKSMIYAQKVCCIHQLGLLVIPRVELVTVEHKNKKYSVLAIETIDRDPDRYDVEETLDEAIKQLTLFSIKTGFIPNQGSTAILNNSLKDGNRKIVLDDFSTISKEHLFVDKLSVAKQYDLCRYPLFGYEDDPSCRDKPSSSGVLGMISERQVKKAIPVAKKHLTWSKKFDRSLAALPNRRKAEMEDYKKLIKFYSERNILDKNEEILIQDDQLNFSKTLKFITHQIVKHLNQAISQPSTRSMQEHRCFHDRLPKHLKEELSTVLAKLKEIKAIYSYRIYPFGEVSIQA